MRIASRPLVVALLLGAQFNLTHPGHAAPDSPPAAQKPAAEHQSATAAAALAQRLREAERRNAELRYERDIAKIHADLIDRQTSWFELLIAAFALVVTVVVIYFSFRFGKAAVAEATREIAAERKEIEQLLEKARAAVDAIKGHEQSAQAIFARLQPGEGPQDETEQKTLRDIASTALRKPIRERTADDYRALVVTAAIDEDWQEMERQAAAMRLLFADADAKSLVFALFNWAYALGQRGRPAEAIAVYDDALARFGNSDDPVLREPVAKALVNKGAALGKTGRGDEAIAAYDDVLARFGNSDDPVLREQVASALFNKGVALSRLRRPAEATAVYDDVLARFGDSDDPVLRERVASALVNKAFALGQMGRGDEAIAAYDDALARFGDSDDPVLREQVAKALVNKGAALGKTGRSDEAIAVYDDVVARFGDSDDPVLREWVARALFNMACSHAQLGDVAAAVASLARWADRRGTFDCNKVAAESDFDGIRDEPAFQALLQAQGCLPPAAA
jgi:tetratricopeptide (TPR) repeat protein